jgi:hypothetical protein
MITDALVHPLKTIPAPAAGGSYPDAFGETVMRVSDAAKTMRPDNGAPCPDIEVEYSGMSPFNQSNGKMLVILFDSFAVYDIASKTITPLPIEVASSSEPRWSLTDPDVFFYHVGVSLRKYNIATGAVTVIRVFSEYSQLSIGGGEADISYDGDHLPLIGDGHAVFVYKITGDVKGPVFDAGSHAIDAVILTPSNRVLVSWMNSDGTGRYQGIELFSAAIVFLHQIYRYNQHKHIALDDDGSEIIVTCDALTNALQKINLDTLAATRIFAPLDWSITWHISVPMGKPGLCALSPYNNQQAVTFPYCNEVDLIPFAPGKTVQRLCQTRGNSGTTPQHANYDGQPHFSISRDGLFGAFNSDWEDGLPDVHLIAIPGAAVPLPAPPPPPPPLAKLSLAGKLTDPVSGKIYSGTVKED